MPVFAKFVCRFAPFLALALLGVFQIIDPASMIALTAALLVIGQRKAVCGAAS